MSKNNKDTHPFDMSSGDNTSPFVTRRSSMTSQGKKGLDNGGGGGGGAVGDGPSYKTWTQKQVIPCVLIYAAMVTQILCLMMIGPGLLDLQLLTGTNIEQSSWFLSARAMGALLGSIILSRTMETRYYWFQLTAALFLSAVPFMIVPWVANFPAVITLFVFMGMGNGYFQTGGMLSLFSIWTEKKDGVSWLNGGQLMLLLGGIAGPLIVRPFFANPALVPLQNTTINGTDIIVNASAVDDFRDLFPDPLPDKPLPPGSETYIMYGFLIGGLSMIVVTILFLVAYFLLGGIHFTVRNPMQGGPNTRRRLLPLRIGIIIVLFMFHVITAVLVRTFASYIVTFTVNYMGWSKEKGSVLTSIVFIFALVGKFACIFLVRVVKTEFQLFAGCVINIIGTGFLLFLINLDDAVIWICMLIIAVGDSNITATILAWTDQYVGIRGIMGALYNIGGTVGEIVAAPLVGWLFQDVSYESFLYLLFICTVLNLTFMVMLQLMGIRYKVLVAIYGQDEVDENKPLVSSEKDEK